MRSVTCGGPQAIIPLAVPSIGSKTILGSCHLLRRYSLVSKISAKSATEESLEVGGADKQSRGTNSPDLKFALYSRYTTEYLHLNLTAIISGKDFFISWKHMPRYTSGKYMTTNYLQH